MEQQIFCDRIGRISIIGGVVRLDLMAFSPSETDANGQPRAILTHRVVMGVDAFLRSSEKILEITRQITAQVAKPASPLPPASVPAASPPPPPSRRENIQPEPPPPPKRPFP